MSYEDGVEFTEWPWSVVDPKDPVEKFSLGYGFDNDGKPAAFLASEHMSCGVTLTADNLRELAASALDIAGRIDARNALANRT